jgi:hypothetical protein
LLELRPIGANYIEANEALSKKDFLQSLKNQNNVFRICPKDSFGEILCLFIICFFEFVFLNFCQIIQEYWMEGTIGRQFTSVNHWLMHL